MATSGGRSTSFDWSDVALAIALAVLVSGLIYTIRTFDPLSAALPSTTVLVMESQETLLVGRPRGVTEFQGVEGQVVSVQADSDDFDTILRLLSPTGEEIARDDDSGGGTDSSVLTMLPVDGLYRIEVEPYGGSSSGTYAVRVAEILVTELDELQWNRVVTGELTSYGLSLWSLDGVAGQIVRIAVSTDNSSVVARLLTPKWEEIRRDATSENSELLVVLPDDGRYFLAVTGLDPLASGLYEVQVDEIESDNVETLEWDEASKAFLETDGRAVWSFSRGVWKFDGSAGQDIEIEVESEDFDTTLRLFSPTGEEVAFNDDGGDGTNSRLEATLPAAGRYLVVVGAYGTSQGSYDLVIR